MKLSAARLTAPFSDLRPELRPRSYLPRYFRLRKTVHAEHIRYDRADKEFIVLINILTIHRPPRVATSNPVTFSQ